MTRIEEQCARQSVGSLHPGDSRAFQFLEAGAGRFVKYVLFSAVVCAVMLQGHAQDATHPDTFRSLLERGFALHQQADYADALPLLQRAWKLEPHDYFANLLVGIDLLRTGHPSDAIGYLQEAAHQRPNEDFPDEYLGEALARLRRYAEATAAYERAVAVAPGSPQAIEGAAGYWVERFRELAAQLRATTSGFAAEYRLQARSHAADDPLRQRLLRRAAELDGDAPGIRGELALANVHAGNTEDARSNIQVALARDPGDQFALEAEARLAASNGEWSDALRALGKVGDASPGRLKRIAIDWPSDLQPPAAMLRDSSLAAFFHCARSSDRNCAADMPAIRPARTRAIPASALFQEHRWEQVLARPMPGSADAMGWYRRGVAFASLDQCAKALPALERAVAGNIPQETHAKFLLSWCYAQEAGRIMNTLPNGSDDAALIHMVRGDVLLRMRADSKAASAEYKAALAVHPDDPEILERLAEAEYEDGQFGDAETMARSSLRIDTYQFSAMETLARIALDQRNYAAAIPYLQQIVAHEPANAAAQAELGTALAQTEDPKGAVEHLLPLLAAGYPDEKGNLHATLGAALRKLNRNTEASQAFAQARALSQAYQSSAHRGEDDRQ